MTGEASNLGPQGHRSKGDVNPPGNIKEECLRVDVPCVVWSLEAS